MAPTPSPHATIDPLAASRWNEADDQRRTQIRRFIRAGRAQETVADAKLAVVYATYQRTRPWFRWAYPLAAVALVASMAFGALAVVVAFGPALVAAGLTFAVAANVAFVRRNYSRVEAVNEAVLAGRPAAGRAKGSKAAKGPKGAQGRKATTGAEGKGSRGSAAVV